MMQPCSNKYKNPILRRGRSSLSICCCRRRMWYAQISPYSLHPTYFFQSPTIHAQYAHASVLQLLACLEEESTSKLWRAKLASYAGSKTQPTVPFISYFASTTPDSEHKRVRLKTALFLQSSDHYDFHGLRDILAGSRFEKVLKLELCILDGKV